MKTALRAVANLFSFVCLGLVLLWPKNKYEWVEALDPKYSASDFVDAADNRTLALAMLLILALAIQLVLLLRAPDPTQKRTTAVVAAIAVFACVSRWML